MGCSRTSPLAKTYGWGVHADAHSRVALVSMDGTYDVAMAEALEFNGTIVHPEWMPDWSVIEVPGSQDFFGTGKSVKANATVDGIKVTSALMPTGQGHHFISVSAVLRKKLGKDVGDEVKVRIASDRPSS